MSALKKGNGRSCCGVDIGRLLKAHARTFALTLGLLPKPLRDPLGIAYLLARASDTIADMGRLERRQRIAILEALENSLSHGDPTSWSTDYLKEAFGERERELIQAIPGLLALLVDLADRNEILRLWRTILEGQLFDLHRFSEASDPLLPNELERYCYLVAGSVGESWTRLIHRHAPEVLNRDLEDMLPLGCSYGKGLQLLNILRDRFEDLTLGRSYFQESARIGLLDLAGERLRSGEEYLSGLSPGRILMASALPYDLAMATLGKIKQARGVARIRIPRREVWSAIARGAASLCLPRRMNPVS